MCDPITIAVSAMAASTAVGAVQAKKANKLQDRAQKQALLQAQKTDQAAEVANNKANQKRPDISAILQRAAAGNMSGQSSTMLTGPMGVGDRLNLGGAATLLGA